MRTPFQTHHNQINPRKTNWFLLRTNTDFAACESAGREYYWLLWRGRLEPNKTLELFWIGWIFFDSLLSSYFFYDTSWFAVRLTISIQQIETISVDLPLQLAISHVFIRNPLWLHFTSYSCVEMLMETFVLCLWQRLEQNETWTCIMKAFTENKEALYFCTIRLLKTCMNTSGTQSMSALEFGSSRILFVWVHGLLHVCS